MISKKKIINNLKKTLDLNRTKFFACGIKAIDEVGNPWKEKTISITSTEIIKTEPILWRIYIDFKAPIKWFNLRDKK